VLLILNLIELGQQMQEIIIFVVGLAGGFLGATVGGGGMVAVPAFLLLGFSPQSAVALNKVGDIGAFIAAAGQYWKSKKIDWKMAIPLTIITTISSIIGAEIMVSLPTYFLKIFIGIMILIFLPFFLFSKNLGLKQTNPSKTRKTIGLILYVLLGIEGAIVGAGGGTVLLLLMMYFFGYKIIRGYATNTPAEIFSALVPAIIYSLHGFTPLLPSVIIFVGMLIGGFIGAHTALKKGNVWVKDLFTVVIILSVIKILFF
jgi:uncharacterized membrane protein YfcA